MIPKAAGATGADFGNIVQNGPRRPATGPPGAQAAGAVTATAA